MMKKAISVLLSIALILTGCSSPSLNGSTTEQTSAMESVSKANENSTELEASAEESKKADKDEPPAETNLDTDSETTGVINSNGLTIKENQNISFKGMEDPELITYVENSVYRDLVANLNSEGYFVENVEAVYISQEYIEELTYNSQSNLYFGYTLAELDKQFEGSRYIFTVDENGKTTVQRLETLYDDSTERIIKNVAVGGGVILLCVTVSVVSGGLGAPAVSMIFAAGAKTGTVFALSSGALSGAAAAITTGYQTQDFDQALEAAALAGSESFKWGAISGAVIGGVSEGTTLYGAAKQTKFTMNQYAKIQQESGYPLDVIKQFHTMDEYRAFRDANLKPTMVGNRCTLVKTDIDLLRVDSKGRTNLERMRQGLAPQDSNGISYELHHIGQKKDGTLAIMTQSEHDNPAIHGFLEKSEAHAPGNNWDAERQAFWKMFAEMVA